MELGPRLPNTFVMCLLEYEGILWLGDHLRQYPHPVVDYYGLYVAPERVRLLLITFGSIYKTVE